MGKNSVEQWWYFTFGFSHDFPRRYIKFWGTADGTREKMVEHFGRRWAFQYPNLNGEQSPRADKWGLTELTIDEIN